MDFELIRNTGDLRDQLRPLARDAKYSWLRPLVGPSHIDEARDALSSSPPQYLAYNPLEIEDLIEEVQGRMQDLINLQKEIHSLTSQGLLMALDYQLAERLRGPDLEIARLRLRADRKIAELDPHLQGLATEETLIDRNKTVVAALAARLFVHTIEDGALNFGERVVTLQSAFKREIRNFYEIAFALRAGLAFLFGIRAPDVPDWSSDQLMASLEEWTSQVATAYRKAKLNQHVYTLVISLGEYLQNVSQKNLLQIISESGVRDPFIFDFNFQADPAIAPSPRLTGCAVGLYYHRSNVMLTAENAYQTDYSTGKGAAEFATKQSWTGTHLEAINELAYATRIHLPKQAVFLSTFVMSATTQWKPAPLHMAARRFVNRSTVEFTDCNCSPKGNWRIEIFPRSDGVWNVPLFPSLPTSFPEWPLSDIKLVLRLAATYTQ